MLTTRGAAGILLVRRAIADVAVDNDQSRPVMGVHGALDVPIQKLVARRHCPLIDPLVCLVSAESCRTVVVELNILGEGA
jgi:hypothetical protein